MTQEDLDRILARAARAPGRPRAHRGQPAAGGRAAGAVQVPRHAARRPQRRLPARAPPRAAGAAGVRGLAEPRRLAQREHPGHVRGRATRGKHVRHHLIDFSSTMGSGSNADREIAPQNPRAGNEYVVELGPGAAHRCSPSASGSGRGGAWTIPRTRRSATSRRSSSGPSCGGRSTRTRPSSACATTTPSGRRRILAEMTDDAVRAVVATGELGDAESERYLAETLDPRAATRSCAHYFARVNPLARLRDGEAAGCGSRTSASGPGWGRWRATSCPGPRFDNATQRHEPLGARPRRRRPRLPSRWMTPSSSPCPSGRWRPRSPRGRRRCASTSAAPARDARSWGSSDEHARGRRAAPVPDRPRAGRLHRRAPGGGRGGGAPAAEPVPAPHRLLRAEDRARAPGAGGRRGRGRVLLRGRAGGGADRLHPALRLDRVAGAAPEAGGAGPSPSSSSASSCSSWPWPRACPTSASSSTSGWASTTWPPSRCSGRSPTTSTPAGRGSGCSR